MLLNLIRGGIIIRPTHPDKLYLHHLNLPNGWMLAEDNTPSGYFAIDDIGQPWHVVESWDKYGKPLGLTPTQLVRGRWRKMECFSYA